MIFVITSRVQQLFYCPEGYAARVIDAVSYVDLTNGLTAVPPPVDLDQLSDALNTTIAVQCEKIRKLWHNTRSISAHRFV